MKCAAASVVQGAVRLDRYQIGRRPQATRQLPRPSHRPRQERSSGDLPDPLRPLVEPSPLLPRARREPLERRGRRIGPVGNDERRAVGPAVVELGVESNRFDVLGQCRTRRPEQVVEHVRQRQQRRTDVDAEPIALHTGQLAAGDVAPLAHHDAPAGGGEPDGRGQPAHSRSDHDDVGPISHVVPMR